METKAYARRYKIEPVQPRMLMRRLVFIGGSEFSLSIFSNCFQRLIRIERVAEAVANVVDRDDGDEDHQARDI